MTDNLHIVIGVIAKRVIGINLLVLIVTMSIIALIPSDKTVQAQSEQKHATINDVKMPSSVDTDKYFTIQITVTNIDINMSKYSFSLRLELDPQKGYFFHDVGESNSFLWAKVEPGSNNTFESRYKILPDDDFSSGKYKVKVTLTYGYWYSRYNKEENNADVYVLDIDVNQSINYFTYFCYGIVIIISIIIIVVIVKKRKKKRIIGIQAKDRLELKQKLRQLTPREFEEFVAQTLISDGFQNVSLTPATSDYGADVLAEKNGIKYVVEVKKYADENLVGRPLIQKLQGAMLHYNANNGIFVTLGFYSKTAQQYGKEQGIWLINGDEFIDMTLKTNTTTIVTSPDTSTPSSTTLSMDLSLPGKPPNKGFGPKWEKSVRSAFNNCPLCNKQESIFLRMFGIRTKLICSNCNAEWTPIFGPFDHKLKHAKLVERGISPLGQTCVKKKMTPEQWNMISINYQIPHP